MPLDQNDEKIIRGIFREELEPTKEDLRSVRQTVYGSDGKGGIKAEIDRHDDEITSLNTFRTQIKTALATVVPAVQIAITVATEWIMAKFR